MGKEDAMKELPEVNQELVDAETLGALFRDIGACAKVLEVILKGAPAARAQASRPTLQEAHDLLLSGGVRGVQIRYTHEGEEWWDTLLAMRSGFRLVRIRQDWS
ncbi:MAG: hypothetical protein ACI8RZ_000784 [Myxococcota bacterium]